jgi:hypothetical protein
MPSIIFTHVGETKGIFPGETLHWWWNHAPSQKVWAFSVDPVMKLWSAYPGASAKIEVMKVEYQHNYDGKSFEREIHFWFKNTGQTEADFNVHMIQVEE